MKRLLPSARGATLWVTAAWLLASGCAAMLASDRPAEKDPAFARCPIGTAAVVDRLAAAFGADGRFDTSRISVQVSPALDPARELETFVRRLDLLGGGTRSFTLVGHRAEMVIELPAGAPLAPLLRPGQLGLHEVDEEATAELADGAHPDDVAATGRQVVVAKDGSEWALMPSALGPGAIASCGARVLEDPSDRPHLALTLTDVAAEAFAALTTRLVGRRLAITLDGALQSAPVVQEPITGGRVHVTMPTAAEWTELAVQVAILNAPPLTARLSLIEQVAVDNE